MTSLITTKFTFERRHGEPVVGKKIRIVNKIKSQQNSGPKLTTPSLVPMRKSATPDSQISLGFQKKKKKKNYSAQSIRGYVN